MTNLTTIDRVCEHLEKYVFDKVWNDPYTEYRTFIKVQNLDKVARTGIFFGRYSQIQLPSEKVAYTNNKNSFFYVYAVPAAYFRSLRFGVLEWARLDEFCTDNLIDVELFSKDGRRCSRAGVFLRQADKNDCILVAVERNAFKSCFGNYAKPTDEFFFGKFFDSDLKPSVRYECFRLDSKDLPANQRSGTKYDPIIKTGTPTYTMYNGRLLTGDYKNILAANAFIEKVYDENILGIVDVSGELETGPLYTTGDGSRRILIHLPKSVNPNHVIITPNTCDIYLVPTKMEDGGGYPQVNATYLYQCGREEHFHQLTHNDFSINYEWLVEYGRQFGFRKFMLKVMVRSENKAKKAIRDSSYLNILYIHTDDEIVNFLLGKSDYPIDFWTARSLEDGPYAKALLRRRLVTQCPEDQCAMCGVSSLCKIKPNKETICPTFNRRKLEDYVDIIGYYHTLALIGKRVTHFEITAERHGNNIFAVRAPLALSDLDSMDFVPIVYHNGIRVDQSKIRFLKDLTKFHPELKELNHCTPNAKELTFTPDATWWTKVIDVNYAHHLWIEVDESFSLGDKVVVELFDHRHDGSIRTFTMQKKTPNYIPTEDTQFSAYKRYFVKVGGSPLQYARATIDPEMIGKPIGPDYKYDVGIKGEDHQPILFSEFYELDVYLRIPMVTTDEWQIYRINEETDGENLVYYRIHDPGIFNDETMELDIDPKYEGLELLVVEGPRTLENSAEFEIDYHSTGILGRELWPTVESIREDLPVTNNFPLDNELAFLNGHRLIRGLDYTMEGYNPGDFHSGAKLYLQNVSYLKRKSNYQLIRTNQTTLSNQRGWIRGNIIQWNHQNPFWFDELSIMTIGGKVCSNLVHELGTITITDPDEHDNGLPYEFRMSVSTKVKNFLGNHGEKLDRERIEVIKAYFDSKYRKPDFITMVKKAYKIYSLYTEAIITDYIGKPEFDFVLTPAKGTFEEQFVDYTDWKDRDVSFTMTHEDFKYVDIYPIFNRLESIDRYQFYKISELARRLLPTDQYKHKDAANVK